jgi:hypothetical protein
VVHRSTEIARLEAELKRLKALPQFVRHSRASTDPFGTQYVALIDDLSLGSGRSSFGVLFFDTHIITQGMRWVRVSDTQFQRCV